MQPRIAYISGGLSLEGMSQNFSKILAPSKNFAGTVLHQLPLDCRRMK
jgi:hypothetical protein